MNFVVIMKAI